MKFLKARQSAGTYRRIAEDILILSVGAGVGVGLTYFCDPHRGRGRRNRLMEEASAFLRHGEGKLKKHGRNLINRVRGLVAETEAAIAPGESSDDALEARVRSRMGHVISHVHDIEVHVRNGAVTLEGRLTHEEKCRVIDEVAGIPGVRRVRDMMQSPWRVSPGVMAGFAAGGAALFGKFKNSHAPASADGANRPANT